MPRSTGSPPTALDGCEEHGAVAVADLAGAERLTRFDQFVAGGKDGYFGTGKDGDVDDAGGGEQPDLGRVETFSGGQYGLTGLHVDADRAHVVAGLNLLVYAYLGSVFAFACSRSVSSIMTTASAPLGSGAPVVM